MIKYLSLSALLIWSSASLSASPDIAHGVTATGTCLKKITQDRVTITFNSSAIAPNANQATNETTAQNKKLRAQIEAMKLANLAMETSFYVGEEFEYTNNKRISKGYRSNIGLQVETSEISRIGDAIAIAVKSGIKNISELRTFVSSEKYKSEYEACLEIASRNAKDKAIKLAAGAGVKLGKAISVDEGSGRNESPDHGGRFVKTMAFAAAEDSASGSAPVIDTKAVDLTVSATVTFEAN